MFHGNYSKSDITKAAVEKLTKKADDLYSKADALRMEANRIAGLANEIKLKKELIQEELLRKNFRLKPDHIKLLKRMEFETLDWGDLACIGVNGKRPFGNSYVGRDIANILGWKLDEDEELTDAQQKKDDRLMEELPLALNLLIERIKS